MKMKKFKTLAGAFCAFAVVSSSLLPAFATLFADAGMSAKVISDSTTFLKDGKLSNVDYHLGDEAVSVVADPADANKKVVSFTSESTAGTQLFTRAWPSVSSVAEDLYNVDIGVEFTINSFVEEEAYKGSLKFGFAFGVQRLADGAGSKNSAYLWFKANENEDGNVAGDEYVYGLTQYDNSGVAISPDLITATNIASLENISITVKQVESGETDITVNGTEYSFDDMSIGYCGFGYESSAYVDAQNYADAYVRTFNFINNYSENPENPVVDMDFSASEINYDLFYVRGAVLAEDGVLKYEKSNGHIITMHKYSNFELTFDVPYLKRTPDYDVNGNWSTSASIGLVIVHGLDIADPRNMGTADTYYAYSGTMWTQIVGDVDAKTGLATQTRYNAGKAGNGYMKGASSTTNPLHHLWNEAYDGRVFSIRLTMKDGLYTLEVKWEDEANYTEIIRLDFGYTQTGYIQIGCGYSAKDPERAYYTSATQYLDNLRIKNLDLNPNIKEVGFTKQPFKNPGPYEYVETRDPNDLFGASGYTGANGTGASSQDFPIWQTVVCGVLVAVGVIAFVIGLKKEK